MALLCDSHLLKLLWNFLRHVVSHFRESIGCLFELWSSIQLQPHQLILDAFCSRMASIWNSSKMMHWAETAMNICAIVSKGSLICTWIIHYTIIHRIYPRVYWKCLWSVVNEDCVRRLWVFNPPPLWTLGRGMTVKKDHPLMIILEGEKKSWSRPEVWSVESWNSHIHCLSFIRWVCLVNTCTRNGHLVVKKQAISRNMCACMREL